MRYRSLMRSILLYSRRLLVVAPTFTHSRTPMTITCCGCCGQEDHDDQNEAAADEQQQRVDSRTRLLSGRRASGKMTVPATNQVVDSNDLKVKLEDGSLGVVSYDGQIVRIAKLLEEDSNTQSPRQVLHSIPVICVLDVKLEEAASKTAPTLVLTALVPRKPSTATSTDSTNAIGVGGELVLRKFLFELVAGDDEQRGWAQTWSEEILGAAYKDSKRSRRVLLLVNPIGGKGKAREVVQSVALPILQAAGCMVEVVETQYNKHAEVFVKDVSLEYDVIATASGDGLIHEVINGLAVRSDARKALKIPITPIPTGSANGMCINLMGVEETFNVPLACLNVIKGKSLPFDLCSITQGDERRFSFMSLAAGLMCDVDIGTEHLRWMGDARFTYGFIRGILSNRPMKCRISIKVDTADKGLMIQRLNASRHSRATKTGLNVHGPPASEQQKGDDRADDDEAPLPPARQLTPDAEWIVLESGTQYGTGQKDLTTTGGSGSGVAPSKGSWKEGEGIIYVYAGAMPYVARDLMQFPVALPGEGVVDVVVQTLVPRTVLATSMNGAELGKHFYLDCQHYYKATAYVLESLSGESLCSVDGEALPFERISVEVHPRLANTLSLVGGWAETKFGL